MIGLRRGTGANAGIKVNSNKAIFFGGRHKTRLDGKREEALVTVMGREFRGPRPAQVL
jgi:hypothetical protein